MHEQWPSHDMRRPRPAAITPADSPAQPPAGALVLFDGSTLEGWTALDGTPARWLVRDGYLEVVPRAGDIQTIHPFGDVQLHLEWAAPVPVTGASQGRGNSGVFLMGRYEIQVLDTYDNPTYADGYAGAVYGQHPPLFNASRPPGAWQSYDVVFRRPRFDATGTLLAPALLTLFHNGVCVQNNVALRGPTGWLCPLPYTPHADKLPLRLQDHGNPVRFRNIWALELPDPDEQPVPPAPALRADVDAAELQPYVGRYCRGGFCAAITLEAGALWLTIGERTLQLDMQQDGRFRVRGGDVVLVFAGAAGGPPSTVTMHIGGDLIRFERQAE
ncbi:MAG TPA: DUF1080 domain-containing protein [Roseiflexaceae bacterium]|nr:DUF1080 domain-containing protein [Roseiflexaceae bacterium]